MEDFCYAGGLPAVMRELADAGLLHAGAMTVTGSGIGANVADAPCWNREVIRAVAEPFQPAGTGTAVLRGNLAPDGAVIKQSASSPHLLKHRGRALVFDSPTDYYAVSNDPGARRRRGHRARRPVLRPARLSRHAGGVQRGAAEEAAAARRPRHGADLRRPDVAAPPTARSSCTWPRRPRPAARWPWCGPATGSPWTCRARTLTLEVSDDELTAPPRAVAAARAARPAGAGPACTPSMCCRPTRALTWTSSSAPAGMRCHATRTSRLNRRAAFGIEAPRLRVTAAAEPVVFTPALSPTTPQAGIRGKRRPSG